MYGKKNENKVVVLKEFRIQNNSKEQEHFIKELFMGMFLRGSELLTWSHFFFHKNVRSTDFLEKSMQNEMLYKANLNRIPI